MQGNGNDAIASKDGLVVQSGTITVDAADDAVHSDGTVHVDGATVNAAAAVARHHPLWTVKVSGHRSGRPECG